MSGGKSGSKVSSFKNWNEIGRGGFGVVYSAERENGDKVAIKKLNKKAIPSRVREEIRTMQQLDHRNIVKLYEVFVENDETYLVMELCEGGSLSSYVRENGPLDDKTAVQVLRQLISAVAHIHLVNKLHRDLSAGNVFIKDVTKNKITVKLGDFGLATSIGRGETACTIVGTPGFIAPQVYRQNYDQSADVYSLGGVLYTMLTAKSPPATGSPNTLEIRNPKAADLVERMMHTKVEERIPLREIVMTEYMKENTDGDGKLFSREHSRESRQRSREPTRSRDALSHERRPLARSTSQPINSARHSSRLSRDRIHRETPSTSHVVLTSENPGGRERQRYCGQGLGPSQERNQSRPQLWPLRMERLIGQRIRTGGGRYIVEMDTRCRFEINSPGDIVRRIMIVEHDQYQQSQTVYVHRITDRIVKARDERDELIELSKKPTVYTSQTQLPPEALNDYMRLHKMVSTLASRVAKITYRRPPQFPDAHAQLMENGDLRIKCEKGVIVRRKENGEIYNSTGNKKEEVHGSILMKVKEVYNYLVRFEQCLQGMGPGIICFPIVFSAGPDIIGNLNNSPSSMLPPASQVSRFPFSTVSNNQQSLVPHSAPFLTKPVSSRSTSSATTNIRRRVSTDENMAPVEAQMKYKMKLDPNTQKVRSIQSSDGRVLRCSTSVADQFIFSDPSIRSTDQRFMRNGKVPERALEMLTKLLERIRSQPRN